MPMFYTPKPRQFKYRPRFYDPEKERWEALKQKYADERAAAEMHTPPPYGSPSPNLGEELNGGMTLVLSRRPPMPTSMTAMSSCWRAK